MQPWPVLGDICNVHLHSDINNNKKYLGLNVLVKSYTQRPDWVEWVLEVPGKKTEQLLGFAKEM